MKRSKPTTQSTRLTALEARQAEMEARIAHLEREAHLNFPNPWITPTDRTYPQFPTPIVPNALERCHICWNKWTDMTHYVCNNDQCPNRVWCGDAIHPTFTCGGTSASTTAGALTLPKSGAGPYGAPGTIMLNNPTS